MCCFSRPVKVVSSTRIVARALPGDRQALVYGMSLRLDEDLAMVLPIPVPAGSPEDAVRFLDLSSDPTFLDAIDALFPAEVARSKGPLRVAAAGQPRQKLKVESVGDFEASFVPSQADFDRLDERFRLPAGVWDKFPMYADWGFCVFKLRPGRGLFSAFKSLVTKVRKVHPMAFVFPNRDSEKIFFPTVHVHDGEVHETAHFDHSLYCQPDPSLEAMLDWQRSEHRAPSFSGAKAELCQPGGFVYRRRMHGDLPNTDTFIDLKKLRRRHAFGPSFRLRMNATWEDVKDPRDATVRRWNKVTEEERMRVKEAVSAKIAAVLEENAAAWGLCPFRHDLPVVHPDFYEKVPEALPPDVKDGCLMSFFVQSEKIESPMLSVSFAAMPAKAAREAIQKVFAGEVERALGAGAP